MDAKIEENPYLCQHNQQIMQISPATLRFVEEHLHADVRALALQASKYPEVDMAMAVTQIAGRQIAEVKVPSWYRVQGLIYPKHLSMEQCSSEATALYKASLMDGESFADLTGGFGIDCSIISSHFKRTHYVERQKELCELAAHNFSLLGLDIKVHHRDGVDFLKNMEPVDCLFLDPARRDGQGGKTVAISDCEPDVSILESLLVEKARMVMIKLSPMLDLSLALNTLKHVSEVHVVSVNNECKELLLMLDACHQGEVKIHTANIGTSRECQHFSFTLNKEHDAVCRIASQWGTYLYEPNASILKAGAYKVLTEVFPVQKLHINSHLYTSDDYLPAFPGRRFKIEGVSGFGKKELKTMLEGVEKANLTVRNFPSSVADLRKRLKLKEGGAIYLFATTGPDERKVLVKCVKS